MAEAATKIRAELKAAGCTKVCNADQTFILHHPDHNDKFIAPVNSARVGSSVQSDDKEGSTLMVTIDLETSSVKNLYWVFTGNTCLCDDVATHKANRDCQVQLDAADGDFRALEEKGIFVRFQHKHWFDGAITIHYLKSLKQMYGPGEKIGLIWDCAPVHKDRRVNEFIKKAEEDGWLKVCYIPGGLTSVMQPCDIVVNAELKLRTKQWYGEWKENKLAELGSEQGHVKIKMDRMELVLAMEKVRADLNEKERASPTIRPCFKKVGLDIWDDGTESAMGEWIKSLSTNALYKSLLQSQTALDFEPPPQARRAGEDDELPREFERFLQTGQPEDEPYY
eukprot:COSAG04_NODE_13_length_42806_cov_92.030323_24_plen_337_part_00